MMECIKKFKGLNKIHFLLHADEHGNLCSSKQKNAGSKLREHDIKRGYYTMAVRTVMQSNFNKWREWYQDIRAMEGNPKIPAPEVVTATWE
jgi:hypothetical protein